MKRTIQILALWAAVSPWAGAQMIIQHSGSNNPTTEGFTLGNGATLLKFPTNDNGTLAWTTIDTNTTENFIYFKNFSATQQAQLAKSWRVIWNAKAIDAPAPRSWEVGMFTTNDTGNTRRYSAFFERSGSDMIVDLFTGPLLTVPGKGDGFHTWEFRRTNSGSDVVEFWVDNMLLTNFSGAPDSGARIEWGSLVSARTSHVEWGLVYVEVPEPSSLLLLGVATAIGFLSRRRK
jgi:hypothetical protein